MTRRVIGAAKNDLCQALAGCLANQSQTVFFLRGSPMTQMMLFDAPVGISTAPVLPAKDTGHQEQGGRFLGLSWGVEIDTAQVARTMQRKRNVKG